MNKFLFSVFIFATASFTSLFSNAQTMKVQCPPGYNLIIEGERTPGVDGSQYLNEQWTTGIITMNDGSTIDSISLRLNAYKSQMHYLNNGKEYSIGSPENIKEIKMGNRTFIYCAYKEGGYVSHNYFEVLVEGKAKLLVLYKVVKIASNYNSALDVGNKNDRLELKENYYIKVGDSIFANDKKGKNLFDSLGDKSDLLKKTIEEEKLSFKKREDLARMIARVNEIL